MDTVRLAQPLARIDVEQLDPEPTEWDLAVYRRVTSTELTEEQVRRIVEPPAVYAQQREVLALHWHPEFIPMDLIRQRVARMYPSAEEQLIIPTQHNILLEWDAFAGVEIDCYSSGFNRKVQLLTHFHRDRVREATVLRAMLDHTFRYRASQLYEFLDSIVEPAFDERVDRAAAKTGAHEDLVKFVRIHVAKLRKLIDRFQGDTYPEMLKNKLLRFYFDALREKFDDRIISQAQNFLNAIKKIVKRGFALDYFYKTEEVIEEVRALGGGVIIPHPEQFWPILLADYDIDGIEVWNPQSREYTDFLVHVVNRNNKTSRDRTLLITMGDDTHFGEKALEPKYQDPEKYNRELGYQPPWDDLVIRKGLIIANATRARLIEEYRARLS